MFHVEQFARAKMCVCGGLLGKVPFGAFFYGENAMVAP